MAFFLPLQGRLSGAKLSVVSIGGTSRKRRAGSNSSKHISTLWKISV